MSNIAWPASLEKNSATQTLDKAFAQDRLGHALLLIANDSATADEAARALAAAVLKGSLPHADYMSVEPMNKQRQIGVEPMRQLREFLQKTSLTGAKVVHISQAERLNVAGANLFLKILEEPPAGSLIVMTTHEPYAVLPTILSRAMRFRLKNTHAADAEHAALDAWTQKLQTFLKSAARESVMERMALINEAYALLQKSEDDTPRAASADDETPKEVLEAQEAGRQKAFKKELFAALENVALESFKDTPDEGVRLAQALKAVERAYRLTEFNLNSAVALEVAVGGVIQALAPSR